MRLNTANRSFVTLVAFALMPYGLIGLFCCGALSLLAYRVSIDGLGVSPTIGGSGPRSASSPSSQ
jgi:hypothetical protein